MKKRSFLFYIIFCTCTIVYAQNHRPSISNVILDDDKENKRLLIKFDLSDNEDQYIAVNVDLLDDTGIPLKGIAMSGAHGDSVSVGNEKRIYCDYSKSIKSSQRILVRLTAHDYHPVQIKDLVEQVHVENLKNDLVFVEGRRFPITRKDAKHHKEVRKFIKGKFGDNGLEISLQDSLMNSFKVQNIIGEKGGVTDPDKHYILCAHYDAYFRSPGADDNASGVAGMLEAMRILSRYNFDRSIRFVGFDMEEDYLLGSRAYTSGRFGDNSKIQGAINLDMIGYFSEEPNTQIVPEGFNLLFPDAYKQVAANNFKGDFIIINYIGSSSDLKNTFQESVSMYTPVKSIALDAAATGEINPELAASDHLSFWKAGAKAIHIGDGGQYRNVHINTKKDKLRLINYKYMVEVVKATVAAMAKLAGINNLISYQELTTIN